MSNRNKNLDMDDSINALGAKTAGMVSFVFFSRLISVLLAGVALVVVARALGPSVYGVYTLAIALAGILGAFGNLGIGTALNKFVSQYSTQKKKEEIEQVLSNGFAVLMVVGIILTFLAFVFSRSLASWILHDPAMAFVFQLASLTIILSMIFGTAYYALIAFENGRHVALAITAQILTQSSTSIIFAVTGFGAIAPIIGLIAGYSVGAVASLYFIYARNRLRFRRPTTKRIKEMLGFSMPIALYNAVTVNSYLMNNLALIVLSIFATTAVIGNVGIALKTEALITVFTDSIGLSILPLFTSTIFRKSMNKNIGVFYNYSVYIAFILIVPTMTYIGLLAKPFVFTVFGGAYDIAYLYMPIVSFGIVMGIVGAYTTTLLISADKTKDVFRYNVIVAIVQLAAFALLIPAYKGGGTIFILFIVAPITTALLSTNIMGKRLGIKLNVARLIIVALASVVSALFIIPLMILLSGNFVLLLLAALVEQILIYPAILSILRAAKPHDLLFLKNSAAKIPIANKIIAALVNYSLFFAPSSQTKT